MCSSLKIWWQQCLESSILSGPTIKLKTLIRRNGCFFVLKPEEANSQESSERIAGKTERQRRLSRCGAKGTARSKLVCKSRNITSSPAILSIFSFQYISSDITLTYMLNFPLFFNIFRQFVNSGYISKTVAGWL